MGRLKIEKKNKRKTTNGMPTWLISTIITVIIVAVLATSVLTLLSTTGFGMRMATAMSSDNYKVSGNMMRYFYINTYSNFTQTYGTYMSYFSIGKSESISDHDDIVFGGTAEAPNTYDTMFFGDFDGTWYDYFMNQTRDSVKTMLIYCEEAKSLEIALTEEELNEIEAAIDSVVLEFQYQQLLSGSGSLDENTCLSAMYGEGMRRTDIREAMKLSTLAAKTQEAIYEKIEAGVSSDRIDSVYNANKIDYDLVDYFHYEFIVNYSEDKGEAKYKEEIEAARLATTELAKKATLEEFKAYVFDYVAKNSYQSAFDQQKFASADLPSEANLAIIKDKIIADVVTQVLAGESAMKTSVVETTAEGAATTYTVHGVSAQKGFADGVKKLEEALFTNVKAAETNGQKDGATYSNTSDLAIWAFADGRAVGDKKVLNSGDGAYNAEVKVEAKSFTADAYFLTKTRYRDESNSKDIAYMMFEKSDEAKKAIEALDKYTALTKENFEQVAKEKNALANTVYEDYTKGAMQSDSFDRWLYDSATVAGTYTKTPLTMSDGSSMVAFYVGEGDIAWRVTVKNSLINEDYTAYEDEMTTKYSASVKATDWIIDLTIKVV